MIEDELKQAINVEEERFSGSLTRRNEIAKKLAFDFGLDDDEGDDADQKEEEEEEKAPTQESLTESQADHKDQDDSKADINNSMQMVNNDMTEMKSKFDYAGGRRSVLPVLDMSAVNDQV